MTGVEIQGPETGAVGETQSFSITVSPVEATAPFTYTIEITDAEDALVDVNNSPNIVTSAAWTTSGVKTVAVTVTNDLGSVSASHEITMIAAVPEGSFIYLPITRR